MPAFDSDLLFGPSVLCFDWLDVCNALCFLAVGFRLNIFPWLPEMFYACFKISSSPFPGARNDFFLTRRSKYWLEISKAQERLKMSERYHSSKSTQSLYMKLTAIFRGWVFHILLLRDCDNWKNFSKKKIPLESSNECSATLCPGTFERNHQGNSQQFRMRRPNSPKNFRTDKWV